MYRIGLTGGVGSGKSTVSNYMHTLGIPVIDGDKLAREAVTPGSQAWRGWSRSSRRKSSMRTALLTA